MRALLLGWEKAIASAMTIMMVTPAPTHTRHRVHWNPCKVAIALRYGG